MSNIYLQIFFQNGDILSVLSRTRMKCLKKKKYKNNKFWISSFFLCYKGRAGLLKLESALVLRDLEGIGVCSSLRNNRIILFILKDRRDQRREALVLSIIKWINIDLVD